MSVKPKILVTSAAGKTGLQVAFQLLEKEYRVRAFVRRLDERSEALKARGAEIFLGNQYAIADMRSAMKGVDGAYHCAPTAPNGLHFGMVFAIAAHETRLKHAVILGQWLAQPDHPSLFTREVWMNEQILKLLPETSVTAINTGWFAENYLMVLEFAAQLGILPMPLGDGDTKKDVGASNEAIASVAAGALMHPELHAGKTYRPTGPELLSPNDVAAAMGRALGRKVSYMNISEKMFLKAVTALRPPLFHFGTLTQLNIYTEEYRRGTFALGGPTKAVQTVGRRMSETFEETVAKAAQSRPEARQGIANKLKALAKFAKIGLTPAPDVKRILADKDYIKLSNPEFCQDNGEWRAGHIERPQLSPASVVGRSG